MSQKYTLRAKCPFCPNHNIPINWKHADCGGTLWIDEEGNVECRECRKECYLDHMVFKCMEGTCIFNRHRRMPIIITDSVPNSFPILKAIVEELNDQKFITNLIDNMKRRLNRYFIE